MRRQLSRSQYFSASTPDYLPIVSIYLQPYDFAVAYSPAHTLAFSVFPEISSGSNVSQAFSIHVGISLLSYAASCNPIEYIIFVGCSLVDFESLLAKFRHNLLTNEAVVVSVTFLDAGDDHLIWPLLSDEFPTLILPRPLIILSICLCINRFTIFEFDLLVAFLLESCSSFLNRYISSLYYWLISSFCAYALFSFSVSCLFVI